MALSELEYAAIEPIENVIRLARDKNGNVYVITRHEERYTAPFGIAYASGELYNEHMQIYRLSDVEHDWVISVSSFAKDLEITQATD